MLPFDDLGLLGFVPSPRFVNNSNSNNNNNNDNNDNDNNNNNDNDNDNIFILPHITK